MLSKLPTFERRLEVLDRQLMDPAVMRDPGQLHNHTTHNYDKLLRAVTRYYI